MRNILNGPNDGIYLCSDRSTLQNPGEDSGGISTLAILLLHWYLEQISLKKQSVSLLKGNRNAKRPKDKSCQPEIFFI